MTTTKKLDSSKNQLIPSLTGLRAIAAYLVYLHHFNPIESKGFAYYFINELHIGVVVFFTLSGFLMTYRYQNIFSLSRLFLKKYLIKRIARIYPIYFLLTVLTFLYSVVDDHISILDKNQFVVLLLNLALLKGFFENIKFSFIAQGWSITVEECFYLACPFIFLLVKNKIFNQIVISMLILLTGFIIVELSSFYGVTSLYGFFSTVNFMLHYTFFGTIFMFSWGTILSIFLQFHDYRSIAKFKHFTFLGLAISLFLVAYISTLQNNIYLYGVKHPLGLFINNFILPISITIFMYGLINEGSSINKMLSSRIMNTLGKSSFAFYLVHMGFINTLIQRFITNNYIVVFILLNFVAIAIHYLVEEPLNKFIRFKYDA